MGRLKDSSPALSCFGEVAVGDIVSGLVGWQDYVVLNPKGQLNKLPPGGLLPVSWTPR